jgi:hypothetical protein
MKYSAGQHLKMAALLDGKASAAADPERQKWLSQFASVHRTLARKAAEQSQKLTGRDAELVGDAGPDGERAGPASSRRPARSRAVRPDAERLISPVEHMKLAALMHRKSQQATTPENRKKLAELAEAHRHIAQVRAKKAKPAEPEFPFADDATYQRALPFFKAGAAHFADETNDIKEMIRGFVRHLNKAGMSPEAIRDMKPYIVRFVEDVRSGKESLDGIPLPVHGGDAGSEPEDVPPAAGQRGTGSVRPRGMECSVPKADLPIVMLDDPPPLATLETWEQYLAEVQSMPDFQGKKNRIAHAKWMIARKKRSRAQGKTKA